MTLKEFMDKHDIGDYVIWLDETVDYAIEFVIKDDLYLNKSNTSKLKSLLIERLTVKEFHNEDFVSVNLYELLDNEYILEYAKKHIDKCYGFENRERNVERLTIDTINLIRFGAEKNCEKMLQAFLFADLQEKSNEKITINDKGNALNNTSNNIPDLYTWFEPGHGKQFAVILEKENVNGHEVGYYKWMNKVYFALRDDGRLTNYHDNIISLKSLVSEIWGDGKTIDEKNSSQQYKHPAIDIINKAINEMERAKYYFEESCQFETDTLNPEEELVEDIGRSIEKLSELSQWFKDNQNIYIGKQSESYIKNATYVSIWDDGDIAIETGCKINMQTGEVFDIEVTDIYSDYVQSCDKEYIRLDNDEEYLVEDGQIVDDSFYEKYLKESKDDVGYIELKSVNTPIGDIIVTPKTDSNYPGVYIDLSGENIRDGYEENTVNLVVVEYDVEKQKMQTIVYGDSLRDDPSVIIEHGNYIDKSLDDLIVSACNVKEQLNKDIDIKSYFEVHVSCGTGDSDGYSIFVELDGVAGEQDALDKVKADRLYQAPEDLNSIDYIDRISKQEYYEYTGRHSSIVSKDGIQMEY